LPDIRFRRDVRLYFAWHDFAVARLTRRVRPEVAAPRILALLRKYRIPTSWYIPGHTLQTYPNQCRQVFDAGHEIGHHGWTHVPPAH
jgi:peptidoglycan/xylan/chitin deacetylase (PgdA/CDA1 family)